MLGGFTIRPECDLFGSETLKALFDRVWHSSTLMTWLSFAAKSGGLLLVTPLVLHYFSPAQTSLWFLFLTINAITQMADFGFGPSFVRAISYARAGRRTLESGESLLSEPNQALLGAIYAVLGKCYDRLAVVGGLIALVLGSLALVKPISQLETPLEGWLGWFIVWLAALVVFRNSAYAQWLQGMNQVALLRRAEAVLALGTTALTAVVLFLTRDLLWSVAAAALGSIASSLAVRWLGRREDLRSVASASAPTASAGGVYSFIWPAAWRSGVGVLMSAAVIQASGIVYAQLVPAEQAAPYLLAMRIMQVLLQVSMAPFYSKLPLFAADYAVGKIGALISVARQGMARAHWVYVAGVLLVAVIAEPALAFIGSQTRFLGTTMWLFLGVAFFVERYGAMHLQFYSLSNHILWHVANGISGSIFLATSLMLLPSLGVAAFPAGIICGYAGFYSWFAASRAYRHYGLPVWEFESRSSLVPALLLLAALALSLFRR